MLEARSIARRAGTQWLLRPADLAIAGGERIALSGPSGAGKTVLLRALALLDSLQGGEILLDGSPIAPAGVPAYRCRVGYLHQAPALADGTVEHNLRLPFSLSAHRRQSFDRHRALDLLRQLGKENEFLRRRRGELSGGEAQITALVRLLQLAPSLLLLDEPTAALDPESAELTRALLGDWQRADADARAYLWVTHDAALAGVAADRHLRLEDGRLEEGHPRGPA
ncbi:MAG: ATP-binding cassette domain-containing protein [Thermoanaerobaculia bacterium]